MRASTDSLLQEDDMGLGWPTLASHWIMPHFSEPSTDRSLWTTRIQSWVHSRQQLLDVSGSTTTMTMGAQSDAGQSLAADILRDLRHLYQCLLPSTTLDVQLPEFIALLQILLPLLHPLKAFDGFWPIYFLPLLSSKSLGNPHASATASLLPKLNLSDFECVSNTLLQLLLSLPDPTAASLTSESPEYPLLTLLQLLHSEDQDQSLKQAVEQILIQYALQSKMPVFSTCLKLLCSKSKFRLSLFVLLTRLLKHPQVPVYVLFESNFFSSIVLQSCWVDSSFLPFKIQCLLIFGIWQ